MALVERWVRNAAAGGNDGSSFDDAFVLGDAIDWINGTWAPGSDTVKIYLCGDLTLASDPADLAVSGEDTGQAIWQGRDDTNGTLDQQITIDADSVATKVFRWNTADLLFRYHHWRQIVVKNVAGTLAAWEFSEGGISRMTWYQCEADTCEYGWRKVDADLAPFCFFEECVAGSNRQDGIRWRQPS